MRRSRLVLVLAVLWLAITPTSAEAWFWRWLDDLSGPQFIGGSFEVRFWCGSPGATSRKNLLEQLERFITAEAISYAQAEQAAVLPAVRTHYGYAKGLSLSALSRVREALGATGNLERTEPLMFDALKRRNLALEHARWARHVSRGVEDDPTKRPPPPSADVVDRFGKLNILSGVDRTILPTLAAPVIGFATSVCPYRPMELNKAFMTADVSFGIDTKDENRGDGNKLLMVGVSAHYSPEPWLTLGVGAGTARFWSRPGAFQKWYVQPLILDVRPFSIGTDPRFRNYLWHSFYLRYSMLTFPQGFEEGRFGGDSPRYERELVNSLSVWFDLEPYLRHRRGKWWKPS